MYLRISSRARRACNVLEKFKHVSAKCPHVIQRRIESVHVFEIFVARALIQFHIKVGRA